MRKVIIASENAMKIEVAKRAFAAVFPGEEFDFVAVKTDSCVGAQPKGFQTLVGARNRYRQVLYEHPSADFWIAQEGGIVFENTGQLYNGNCIYNRAYIVIGDSSGRVRENHTASFMLPNRVADLIRSGMELRDAALAVFSSEQLKGNILGLLTDGILDRVEYYLQPAIICLCELKNWELYK